ncbi:MAG: Pseudouridine synthase [Actinobacteria bacterium]|nr:Pseudouridine synthase [Actinomycetota bacterium]
MPIERLNRYISLAAGVSRRTADEIVRNGRVTVAGRQVLDPGAFLDPGKDEVRLDGNTLVPVREEKIYVMAYKPDNVVTTMKDKEGRQTAASLVGDMASRVFPVGRLDYHTTGLLLFTNDGDLAYKLTHPKFGVEKTYVAKLMGEPLPVKLKILRRGLPIDGVMTNPAHVTMVDKREGKSWIAIRIAEGRYHQVRKMFEAIGHKVMKLRRSSIGPLELSGVEPGEWRYLTGKEVRELMAYVDQKEREPRATPKREPHAGKTKFVPRAKRLQPPAAQAAPGKGPGTPSAPQRASVDRKGPRQPKPEWKKPSKGPGSPSSPRPGVRPGPSRGGGFRSPGKKQGAPRRGKGQGR